MQTKHLRAFCALLLLLLGGCRLPATEIPVSPTPSPWVTPVPESPSPSPPPTPTPSPSPVRESVSKATWENACTRFLGDAHTSPAETRTAAGTPALTNWEDASYEIARLIDMNMDGVPELMLCYFQVPCTSAHLWTEYYSFADGQFRWFYTDLDGAPLTLLRDRETGGLRYGIVPALWYYAAASPWGNVYSEYSDGRIELFPADEPAPPERLLGAGIDGWALWQRCESLLEKPISDDEEDIAAATYDETALLSAFADDVTAYKTEDGQEISLSADEYVAARAAFFARYEALGACDFECGAESHRVQTRLFDGLYDITWRSTPEDIAAVVAAYAARESEPWLALVSAAYVGATVPGRPVSDWNKFIKMV